MISQKEIQVYLDREAEFEKISQEYSEGRHSLISRLSKGEKVQAGKFVLKFKPFDRTNTRWAEVIKSLMEIVKNKLEITHSENVRKFAIRLRDRYDYFRGKYSNTSHQAMLRIKIRKMKKVFVEEAV